MTCFDEPQQPLDDAGGDAMPFKVDERLFGSGENDQRWAVGIEDEVVGE